VCYAFRLQTEEIMTGGYGGYIIARENFKEAEKHVSAETDPVMFNLLYGLQSLTDQIDADFALVRAALTGLHAPTPKKRQPQKPQAKKAPAKRARAKTASKTALRSR
jgi:hypothetical protein